MLSLTPGNVAAGPMKPLRMQHSFKQPTAPAGLQFPGCPGIAIGSNISTGSWPHIPSPPFSLPLWVPCPLSSAGMDSSGSHVSLLWSTLCTFMAGTRDLHKRLAFFMDWALNVLYDFLFYWLKSDFCIKGIKKRLYFYMVNNLNSRVCWSSKLVGRLA